jgi:hypothetical protein
MGVVRLLSPSSRARVDRIGRFCTTGRSGCVIQRRFDQQTVDAGIGVQTYPCMCEALLRKLSQSSSELQLPVELRCAKEIVLTDCRSVYDGRRTGLREPSVIAPMPLPNAPECPSLPLQCFFLQQGSCWVEYGADRDQI